MIYGQATVSVGSATVPVSLILPGTKRSWIIKPRTGAAVPILVFVYSGPLPSTVPASVFEVTANQSLSDFDYTMQQTFEQGLGAVLESGTTAVIVDAMWK